MAACPPRGRRRAPRSRTPVAGRLFRSDCQCPRCRRTTRTSARLVAQAVRALVGSRARRSRPRPAAGRSRSGPSSPPSRARRAARCRRGGSSRSPPTPRRGRSVTPESMDTLLHMACVRRGVRVHVAVIASRHEPDVRCPPRSRLSSGMARSCRRRRDACSSPSQSERRLDAGWRRRTTRASGPADQRQSFRCRRARRQHRRLQPSSSSCGSAGENTTGIAHRAPRPPARGSATQLRTSPQAAGYTAHLAAVDVPEQSGPARDSTYLGRRLVPVGERICIRRPGLRRPPSRSSLAAAHAVEPGRRSTWTG